jgi:hypothetical protein
MVRVVGGSKEGFVREMDREEESLERKLRKDISSGEEARNWQVRISVSPGINPGNSRLPQSKIIMK